MVDGLICFLTSTDIIITSCYACSFAGKYSICSINYDYYVSEASVGARLKKVKTVVFIGNNTLVV